ncbi:hypothetical protein KUV35_01115 [Marinobacter salsuginis]|uniref:hypothetical protein n=1 Tax=Marinobacter salsuginis TaxID=418719 RepID=UPI001C9572B8|nr:hypothetical protein [Marinobacter salsuginis]MBY6069880.1 hypothetical protein [Marinobacter salsuginis]
MSKELGQTEIIHFLERIIFGTPSGLLIKTGVLFLILGKWDVVLYLFDTYVTGKDVEHPADSFGWSQYFGLLCFFLGFFIKLIAHFKENNSKLREERIRLKENYSNLSDARLQDDFERLFRVKCADVRAIKNLLGHPYNKNMVVQLFSACHGNVEPKEGWFEEKGKYFKLRYTLAFLFWWLLPVAIILSLILASAEYFVPGISNSGPFAVYGFLLLAAAATVGAKLLWNDISALAQATTLVTDYKP